MSKQYTHLKELAKRVGLKLRTEPQDDGSFDLVLCDGRGERLCTEYDTNDMVESIGVYAGGHREFKDAVAEYETAVA